MKIVIGSTNKAKLDAVREILQEYPHLAHAHIEGASVESGVADQPKSLDETVLGAMNRAKRTKGEADYGVGIESGLMHVPHSKSGYMDVCVAAIYDGIDCHIGLSSAWEFPDPTIIGHVINGGMNLSEAINHAGLTQNPDIGQAEGAIGILTKGRIDRKGYTKEALRMALIHLDPL